MSKTEVTDAMLQAARSAWNRPNGSFDDAIEAAFALIPQPDERRVAAERRVIDKVAAWVNQRCYPPVDVEKVLLDELWNAYFALRGIDTPPDTVEELLAALRFDTNIKSARVCRSALALERERKGMKS